MGKKSIPFKKLKALINESGFFDRVYYLSEYRDVRLANESPIDHYCKIGIKEHRNPNSKFDSLWYREYYQDVREDGAYSIVHYIIHGFKEHRFVNKKEEEEYQLINQSGQFNKEYYQKKYVDLGSLEENESFDFLLHYIRYGKKEGREFINKIEEEEYQLISGSGQFDEVYYKKKYEDLETLGENFDFLRHYVRYGKKEGRIFINEEEEKEYRFIKNSGLFDEKYYQKKNKDIGGLEGSENFDFLLHYIRYGRNEGRDFINKIEEEEYQLIKGSGQFDKVYYQKRYEDLEALEESFDFLLHYVRHGRYEGRKFINEKEESDYQKINSSGQFDKIYYQKAYKDLEGLSEDFDFLLHYVRYGKDGGRNYSPPQINQDFEQERNKEARKQVINSSVREDYEIIKESNLFNSIYYLSNCPEVNDLDIDAIEHFCLYGWKELKNPNEKFSVKYYLEKYPDVASINFNPFVHWIKYGENESRFINLIEFDTKTNECINNPSIIFLSHEASQTGAPAVLISLMKWIKKNTDINFSIIIGETGPWNNRFEELAQCFYMDGDYKDFRKELRDFCGNHVQSVYLNTIASGIYAEHLKFLNAEFITHVHEMENVFSLLEPRFEIIKDLCSKFIGVSQGSIDAIKKRTTDKKIDLIFLKPFIEPKITRTIPFQKPTDKKIIFGCGAAEIRKGFDIFCDIGLQLLNEGYKDFKMIWIGSAENKDLNPYDEIAKRNIEEYVEFIGAKNYPRDYFEFGDLFLLPSREDPYPLVCMEAAECNMPVVCFDEKAGGMHSFVEEDAGIIVPYLDVNYMVNAILELLKDDLKREKLAERAHAKVKERHYVDVIAPKILEHFPKLKNSIALTELDSYKELIDKYKIISFDIFDTLITRRVNDPGVVFDIVEYEHTKNESGTLPLFEERMQTAGKILGKYQGKKDDISINEIYEGMSFYKDSEVEKRVEIQMCTANPLGIKLYNYALGKNKKIYITSDMYLDADTIKRMLNKCNVIKWDEFLLSSEQGKKKDTGKLYEKLLLSAKKEKINKEEILHIGDNWVGDVDKAKSSGIDAIRFNPIYEANHKLFKITDSNKEKLSQIGRIWESFCTQSTNLWGEYNSELSKDFYTKLGFELTGPLATMMAMHVKLQADQVGAKRIVFMARDGRIIKRAFDSLYKKELLHNKFDSLYLNLSRSTVVPATFENPLTSNDIYFLIEGLQLNQKKLSYFINKANLNIKDTKVKRIVKKHFTSLDEILTWDDLDALSNMFQDLSENVYHANEESRLALKCYLDKYELLSEKDIIVVDVGWLLNIQSRLDKFIKQFTTTKIIGCYVGSRDRVNKNLDYSCLLFERGDPSFYAKVLEENTTLFEVLFSAPEPSAKKLKLVKSKKVVIDLKELDTPLSSEFITAQKIQMGAEAFFNYLNEAQADFLPKQISKDYFFTLFEALVKTDNEEAKANLGNFEVKLGGHHEFIAYEALVKNDANVEYRIKSNDEYFDPILYEVENIKSKIVIVTSAGLDNGSTRYRGLNLAQSLQNHGMSSTVIHSVTSLEKANQIIFEADSIIFQRCFEEQGNVWAFLKMAKEHKKKCIYEIDDLVLPEFVKTIGSVKGGQWNLDEAMRVAKSYEDAIIKMDSCIVSTPNLKTYVEGKYKIPACLVRNKIDNFYLKEPQDENNETLKLIYASGTYSHKEDFEIVESVLYDFLIKNKNVQLSILGYAQVSGRLLVLPNVNNYPILKYKDMLNLISKHDLMLVPLVDDVFNRAKSSVKFVECGAVGVPVLASKVGEFDFAIKHKKDGLLASNALEWKKLLELIAVDFGLLKELKKNAFKKVKEEYNTLTCEKVI